MAYGYFGYWIQIVWRDMDGKKWIIQKVLPQQSLTDETW